jgi:dual-specificity kinase
MSVYLDLQQTNLATVLNHGMQNLIMQHVDHSAGDLIELLQGLLRYEPAERLKAREALRHPFFTRDVRRGGYPV